MKILGALVLIMLHVSLSYSQNANVKPLKPGNKWCYSQTGYAHGGIDLDGEYVEIVSTDSLVLNDSVFHYIRGFFYPANGGNTWELDQRYEMSDSTGVIYRGLNGVTDRVWDFSYPVGDTIQGISGMTVILAHYDTLIFSDFSDMVYVWTSTDHFNFSYDNHIKAVNGLGLVYLIVNGIDHNLTRNLHGALLDGIAYGDTSIIISSTITAEGNPNDYTLYQNYPNPFNPVTTITYEITQAGLVTLRVFNVLGREVAILVNEKKNRGRYSVNFSAEGFTVGEDEARLASGVYIYQLRVNDYVDSKKMLMIK